MLYIVISIVNYYKSETDCKRIILQRSCMQIIDNKGTIYTVADRGAGLLAEEGTAAERIEDISQLLTEELSNAAIPPFSIKLFIFALALLEHLI